MQLKNVEKRKFKVIHEQQNHIRIVEEDQKNTIILTNAFQRYIHFKRLCHS